MHIELISSEKDEAEFTIDNQTVAELMRVYLNEIDGVKFASWRKDHPFKPFVMRVTTSGASVKKVIGEAVATISKDLESFEVVLKKK